MQLKEINYNLITMIQTLINSGWKKTKIAQILLGQNGQTQINNLLKPNNASNLGIKPLTKIAELLDHDILIDFNERDNLKFIEQIEQKNIKFIKSLETAIQDCLENIETSTLKTAAPQTNKELQILITDIFEI